ncbi:MAG: right-handed parallel beta-helix repeat-containing protein [Methanobrevibacter thaueri]|nr:right-handed parallel beta-helix repeat-containing protein [Methanobrevibacter thaueri]
MKIKTLSLIIFAIFILLISTGAVFSQDNLTSDNMDENVINKGEIKYISDIQIEIDNASENDVIELNGTYPSDGSSISINKNLTFNGNDNCTVEGYQITATSENLIFKNIAFKNFEGIFLTGTTIFMNCNFTNCHSTLNGAINTNGNSEFHNCYFINNGRGSVSALNLKGNSTITNCKFINNHALNAGAIYNEGNLTIINSSFTNHTASNCVGVIWSGYNYTKDYNSISWPSNSENPGIKADTVKIINTIFENNTAKDRVGVIFSSLNLIIDNSTFINNNAAFMGVILSTNDLMINNSRFSKNSAINSHVFNTGEGLISAINSIYGKTSILNSKFNENNADYATISLSKTTVNMSNNIFNNNSLGTIFIGDCNSTYPEYTILDDDGKSIKLFELIAPDVISERYEEKPIIATLINPITSKPIPDILIESAYTYSHYTTHTSDITKSDGKISLSPVTGAIGSHTINLYLYSSTFWENFANITMKYTVTKIQTTIKAPSVTFKYKKSKYFKVTVHHKKKPVKKVSVKIKIDKKVYKVKTDSKGIAKINTKKLKVGKHKVNISSGSSDYQMSAKSTIKIKR